MLRKAISLVAGACLSFVAGADIKEMAGLDRSSAVTFIENLRQLCDGVRLLSMAVIAGVPGWCLGGGMELAEKGKHARYCFTYLDNPILWGVCNTGWLEAH